MDICFFSPITRIHNHYTPPFNLMSLSSYLEGRGISTHIIDLNKDCPVFELDEEKIIQLRNKIIDEVLSMKPLIIGIPCFSSELKEVIEISRVIKTKHENVKIIVGQIHPTLFPEEFFFESSPIDYAVVGEGEITTFELVNSIKNGNENMEEIDGLVYFNKKNNALIKTKPRSLIENLDDLPFPAYDKVNMWYYTKPNVYKIRGIFISSTLIHTTRGCPYNCTFCVSSNLRKKTGPGKYARMRSAKNIADEIEFLMKNYKIDSFFPIDDDFLVDKKRIMQFCDELEKRKINLPWGCGARVTDVSEDLLKRMKRAGCVQLDFGVESGSDEMLKRVKKNITVEQTKKAFVLCRKYGIRTFSNVLFNLPEETEDDLDKTLKLLDEIKSTVTAFNIFVPYIGTEIYNKCNVNLSIEEYSKLTFSAGTIPATTTDPRFIFHKHNVNLIKFCEKNTKKYNSIVRALSTLFSKWYLMQILRSSRKYEYFKEIKNLLKEVLTRI